MSIEHLKHKLNRVQRRVNMRYAYYEMKNRENLYNTILPKKYKHLNTSLGWCAKSVDTLADRLHVYGFYKDGFNLEDIYNLNNRDVLFDSAILSALISSCSFIYVAEPDGENIPRLQVIDGRNATGTIDPITNMLKEGYAVLETDEKGNPTLEAYFETGQTTYFRKGEEPFTIENCAPYPLLVPIIYRPDAKRPFGHSRISRACMDYTKLAIQNVLLATVSAEYYSFPQKYALGIDESIIEEFKTNRTRASISDFLAFTNNDNGENVKLGQFSTGAMTPYLDMMRMYGSLFAGETGLTLDDLGFVQSNPSSAEAIKASHENLRLYARKAQRSFSTGFINAGFLAACLRDKETYKRYALYETKMQWEPIFEPDMNALSAIGDGILKINQAVPGYLGKESMRLLTGIEAEDDQ